VTVPEALISIAELPEQAVRPSNDAIVHGDLARESGSPLLIDADIDLRLGEEVRYEGSGLFADLDGGLRLRYSTQTSANAAGTLSVTGRYEAFGQELSLERGELIFTGAIENPTLDIRAVRDVDEIRVGIDLTGTLQAPVSRMFSEPPMAEADALSYLLFGRPLAAPEGGDSDQLRNAALALGLRQAVPAIQRIGDTLGLDEFAIESTSVDAGELMAGKYLSPKLYVRYSYGLFNRIGGLLLQYQLNERFSIETRSGDQKSMDVLYTIERD
jgi:translocation and assembly module TamB